MISKVNMIARTNSNNRYQNILTMLLRLRQLADHIFMSMSQRETLKVPMSNVENSSRTSARLFGTGRLREDPRDHGIDVHRSDGRGSSGTAVRVWRTWTGQTTSLTSCNRLGLRKLLALHIPDPRHPKGTKMLGTQSRDDEPPLDPNSPAAARKYFQKYSDNIGKHHGLKFDFRCFLRQLKSRTWEDMEERTKCVICADSPEKPWVTSCFHICRELLNFPGWGAPLTNLSRLFCLFG